MHGSGPAGQQTPRRDSSRVQAAEREDSRRTVSERVIDALATSEGVDPLALTQPLNDSIDPDALDALFAPRHDGSPREGDGFVTFTSNGYRVTVKKNGEIRVESL